jgi:hypothetical protein
MLFLNKPPIGFKRNESSKSSNKKLGFKKNEISSEFIDKMTKMNVLYSWTNPSHKY